MITIHHLGVSQSDRIVWLMEELGLPYRLKWHHRGENRLMQPEYLALHPAATAPVIEDNGRVLTESAVIVEYICHRHAGGKFTVNAAQDNYFDYLYWMHFNNNALGLFFAKLTLGAVQDPAAAEVANTLIVGRENRYFNYLNQRLGEVPYLAGNEFTCADIMVGFHVTTMPILRGRPIDDLPHVQAYAKRIGSRPAYIKAMSIAGPQATPADR